VFGSIILASVLLKTGGYGGFLLLRMFGSVGGFRVIIIGCVFSAFIILLQRDFKSVIAFMSVFHISLIFLLFCFNFYFVIQVSFVMFFLHSVISGLFFILASDLFYARGTRNLLLNFGVLTLLRETMVFLLVLTLLVNLGVPPTLRFFFEVGVCYFLVL